MGDDVKIQWDGIKFDIQKINLNIFKNHSYGTY